MAICGSTFNCDRATQPCLYSAAPSFIVVSRVGAWPRAHEPAPKPFQFALGASRAPLSMRARAERPDIELLLMRHERRRRRREPLATAVKQSFISWLRGGVSRPWGVAGQLPDRRQIGLAASLRRNSAVGNMPRSMTQMRGALAIRRFDFAESRQRRVSAVLRTGLHTPAESPRRSR